MAIAMSHINVKRNKTNLKYFLLHCLQSDQKFLRGFLSKTLKEGLFLSNTYAKKYFLKDRKLQQIQLNIFHKCSKTMKNCEW
jgi:hypothetical protein